VLGWLSWDGWGFFQGFFRAGSTIERHRLRRPARNPSVRTMHDQGLGRALLFYAGARPETAAAVIDGFPPHRRADLWAGVALATAYTGAVAPPDVRRLADLGRDHAADLAQGAAFAAAARLRDGHLPPMGAAAVRILTGAEPELAAAWTDVALAAVLGGADTPEGYERWRAGVRECWATQHGGAP
jgi:hypothetical protein